MARIAKDPEERRSELIEAAQKLFITNGFEKTLVSDIVKSLGVAQGTFYYYFKSKDEVMSAILDSMWHDFAAEAAEILEDKGLKPLQKLNIVFLQLFKRESGGDERLKIFENIGDESTAVKFHNYSDSARIRCFGPIIKKIVKEGITAGVFGNMQYSDEVTEIVFMGVNTYMHTYYPYFNDHDFYMHKMAALEELFERVLEIKKGSLKFSN